MTQLLHRTLPLLSILALAATAAAQEHDLRSTAKKGSTAYFVQTTKQEQSIDMEGQAMEMGNTINYTIKLAVTEIGEKGELQVAVDILRVEGALLLPMMGEVAFDSAAGPTEDDGFGMSALGDAMASLAGQKFTATVSPYGKVEKAIGTAEILEAARKKGGQMGGQMLASSLSEKVLENLVENAFGVLPDKPIAKGGKWTHSETAKESRTQVDNKMELTLTEIDDAAFVIDATGTVSKPGGEAPALGTDEGEEAAMAREMMANMKIKNGKIGGKIKVSRTDGFIVESTSTMSMDIEMPSPMGGGEMTIAMKQTSGTKRTTAEAAMPKKKDAEPVKK